MTNKTNPSSSNATESPTVRLWQSAMGNHHWAARRRRWVFFSLLIVISALLAFQAPADLELLVKWFFSARSYGHLFALGLAFWLTFRTAASSQQSLFHLTDLGQAQKKLWRSAFNGSTAALRLQGGKLKDENPLLHAGGPGNIKVHMDSSAVIEPFSGKARVIAPSEKAEYLHGFERIREIIDVRDQVVNLNLWGRTRDGIRVQVKSARIVYSIHRGGREASLGEPHPFDEKAALSIAFDRRVELTSPSKESRNQHTSALGELGSSLFEQQLQAFIANINLGELLASSSEDSGGDIEDSGALRLAREVLRRKFISYCQPATRERGLDLHWVDLGVWKVDELAQEIIEDFQAEQMNFPRLDKGSYQESRSQELNRLFGQLSQLDQDELEGTDGDALRARLINAYYGLFDGLKLRYGELLGDDEQQIDIVLRFLKVLNRDLEPKQ